MVRSLRLSQVQGTWGGHLKRPILEFHIDRITGNANRTLGYIRRNIKTKNQKVRQTAYNTLVRPQLEYSVPVWDPSTIDKTCKLEKIQRRAARWTTSNYDTRSSVSAMLSQLGWRTRAKTGRYKVVYGNVAVPLPNYVQPTHRASRYCHSMTSPNPNQYKLL